LIYLQAPLKILSDRFRSLALSAEQVIGNMYFDVLNEAYTQFFHYYEDAPLLIVNATDINFVDNDEDYRQLMQQVRSIRSGRHYFNPVPMKSLGG
jgi:deoxyadenosine/deoxycytidine kinase